MIGLLLIYILKYFLSFLKFVQILNHIPQGPFLFIRKF
jgi:hypothetical protein